MEDIVHIYGLVRFVTGFLEKGEEAKKNHKQQTLTFLMLQIGNLKREKPGMLISCSLLPCFCIRVKFCTRFGLPFSM